MRYLMSHLFLSNPRVAKMKDCDYCMCKEDRVYIYSSFNPSLVTSVTKLVKRVTCGICHFVMYYIKNNIRDALTKL